MFRALAIAFICVSISSCAENRVTANVDYTKTSLGFRNSGALTAGKLYLWDTKRNELTDLRTPVELDERSKTNPATLTATSVSGFKLTGDAKVSDVALSQVALDFSRTATFEAKNAVRVDNYNIYTALSKAYKALRASGVDNYQAWHIGDIKSDHDRYKFVLTVDPVYATEETLSFNSPNSTSGKLIVSGTDVGKVEVSVPDNATATCKGQAAQCFVGLAVLDVYVKDDGNLEYVPNGAYDRDKLSDALRGL